MLFSGDGQHLNFKLECGKWFPSAAGIPFSPETSLVFSKPHMLRPAFVYIVGSSPARTCGGMYGVMVENRLVLDNQPSHVPRERMLFTLCAPPLLFLVFFG